MSSRRPHDDARAPSDAETLGAGTVAAAPAEPSRGAARKAGPDRPRVRGEQVGRYILLNELGAGAMGVVWAAYDPELDRRVAVKLLVRGDQSERLLREAQALARLAHPNVVAVFDAGESEGAVWLAMELVSGVTLKTWLNSQDKDPDWRAVLDVLIPAGRGVAAAHAAGLIHRDLKPDNLMIGGDGRARVMDFGLARAGEAAGLSEDIGAIDGLLVSRSSILSSDVTRTGAILGTPAYMAPEQLRGRADERSDVFALCVVLWEALHGARPFGGETVAATVLAISEGRFQTPPRGRGVPRWLRRALARGLALRPADRWPGVEALLDALERGRARHRRGRLLAGVAVAAAGVAAALGGLAVERGRRVAACEAEGATVEAVWPGRAADVAAALERSTLPFAATTHAKIVPLLDAWAGRWRDERRDACLAATVERSLAAETHERAELCLDLQRVQVEHLLAGVAEGNRSAVASAIPSLVGLSGASSCLDPRALERGTWPTGERRAEARDLKIRTVRVAISRIAGEYDRALADAQALRAEAEALGFAPLVLELDLHVSALMVRKSRMKEAEAVLRGVYFQAGRIGADSLARTAANQLTLLVGHQLGRPAEGLEWGEHARMLVARLGEEGDTPESDVLIDLSTVQLDAGAYDRALELAQQALAIRERRLDPMHIDLARALGGVALALQELGRHAEAVPLLERVLALREAAQGSEHPDICAALNNLALALQRRADDRPRARALFEQAIALHEKLGEGDTPRVAGSLNNLMMIYAGEDRFEEAIRLGERSLAIREAQLGPDHPQTLSSMNNLGIIYLEHGQADRALALHERALAAREARLGPEHPEVARSLTNLAETQIRRGHPELALPLAGRARDIRTKAKVAPQDLAYTQYILAQALAATGDRARARTLADEAAAAFRSAGDERVADVDKLLASLASPKRPTTRKRKRKR